MKKISPGILFVLLITHSFAQEIKVIRTEKLPLSLAKEVCFPVYSLSGSKILYTQPNYQGLFLIDLDTREEYTISNEPGAGFKPVISPDEEEIFFRENSYSSGRKMSQLKSWNKKKSQTEVLVEKCRSLSTPVLINNEILLTKGNQNLHFPVSNTSKSATPRRAVLSINQKIILLTGRETTSLAPFGEGNYIWASLSPDESKILFTLAGKGTFICDLQGQIISSLGYINSPVWYNNEWIVGMNDKDDGVQVIQSDIIAIHTHGKKIMLTKTDDIIEMYPSCSAARNSIAFHTLTGEVYTMEINITQ